MRCRTLALLLTTTLAAVPASAQQLTLTIQNGLVNLDAQNASIRQVLDAWSRVGGTKIVNGERVTGGPVTLKLVNTPERQAIEILLRSAAGYMAVPRSASTTPGDSMFSAIMVLPTSSAPQGGSRAAAPPPPQQNPFFRGRTGEEDETPTTEVGGGGGNDDGNPPVFSFPNQGMPAPENANVQPQQQQANPFAPTAAPANQNNPFAPTPVPQAQPVQTPFGQIQPPQGGQPVMNPFAAALSAAQQQQQQQQQAPPPGTFQILGTPTPGAPPPQQPTNPFLPQRPPGQ